MNVCEDYEDYIKMIARVLGWENTENGEGFFPFVKACSSYDPKYGMFSTWLWHNLIMHKKKINNKKAKLNGAKFVPIHYRKNVPEEVDIAVIFESKDWIRTQISRLSEDSQKLILCLFEGQSESIKIDTKGKRTKFPKNTVGKNTVKRELKEYCIKQLNWKPQRYLKAAKEIKTMLKTL